ncbi:MAG: ParB N-terminal domain-containing protein [Planctomycetaceae bacterium]
MLNDELPNVESISWEFTEQSQRVEHALYSPERVADSKDQQPKDLASEFERLWKNASKAEQAAARGRVEKLMMPQVVIAKPCNPDETVRGNLVRIAGFEVHSQLVKFPLLEGAEFEELVASIATNGLRKRITITHDHVLVDGRNRLRACIKAGVDPQFELLPEDADCLQVMLDENVLRRQLSISQRAMFAVELAYGMGRMSN